MRAAPDWALEDEMVTIRPQRAAIMSGTAACTQWKVPVRFTERTRSQLSCVMSAKDSNASSPALVTRISTGPSSARTLARASSTAARSATSTSAAITRAPVSSRLSAARRAASPRRSSSATRSPRAARCRAMASPIPEAAPVTTATLPIAPPPSDAPGPDYARLPGNSQGCSRFLRRRFSSDLRGVGGRRVVLDVALHPARDLGRGELARKPERHVDARRDARGRDEVAVAHVARAVEHRHVAAGAQRLHEGPVRGDAPTLREARLVEQQHAGADARHPLAALAHLADPLDQRRVVHLAARALSAGDEQHVELGGIREGVVGRDAQPLGAAHDAAALADRHHPTLAGGRAEGREHL